MGFLVECSFDDCTNVSWATNIVDLIQNYINTDGWLICKKCNRPGGYINKIYSLPQEDGETWEPIIRGIILINDNDKDTYQPFIFLVTYDMPNNQPTDYWFCYYKDTRHLPNGRLKMGHGPGGPPVLWEDGLISLINKLINLKRLSKEKLIKIIK